MHHRLLPLFVLAALNPACTVDTAEAPLEEGPVDTAEGKFLPLLPFCVGPVVKPQTARSFGGFNERVDLFGPGDRSDFAFSDATLSAPSSLYRRVTVTATVDITLASLEMFMLPFGYVAGGVNLLLEVKDGDRVLCSKPLTLVERSTIAGSMDDGASRGVRTLSCSFDATGLTRTPVAHTSLETWATVAGQGTAYIKGAGTTPRIEETRCMVFNFTP